MSLPGFQTFVQTGNLSVNDSPNFNIALQVGQVAQTIEVQANAALVETRTVGVSQLIENERIVELPLNGRNVTELVILSGAAVSTGTSSTRSMPGQQEISVAGSQEGAVAYLLDGAPHNNWYDNLSLPLPFPDALGEFKIETSALQAQQGLRSGANVNAVTRSGTNEYHGNAFWFVRNDLFGARPYAATRASSLKRNQYGGAIGGPVMENKLFFFAGYQGTTIRQDPGTVEDFLPTPYVISTGDWSRMLSPSCADSPVNSLSAFQDDGITPTGFVGGTQIDPALYSPVAMRVMATLPNNLADDCGRILYGNILQDDDYQIVGRVDYQATDSHSIMGRLLLTASDRAHPYELTQNPLSSSVAGWDDLGQSYTLGDTWLMDATTVLSTRLAVNYTNVDRLGANYFDWADLGVPNYHVYVENFARMTADDGFTLGGCTTNPASFDTFSASLNSDLSMSRGDHQWGFGGYINRLDNPGYANCFSPGTFDFDGAQTGWGLADFMIGQSNTFDQATPNTQLSKKWVSAFYMADTWRLTPNVTMSYGVRWEPDMPETITNERVLQFSRAGFDSLARSTRFVNAPAGFTFPGDAGFPGISGRDKHWTNFSPRLGLAWDVFGDGRTSIRASGGIGYDYPNGQFHLWTSLNPPFGGNASVKRALLDNPFPGGNNPHPLDLTREDLEFLPFQNIQSMDASVRSSQTQSWNLALQQQLGQDWLLSATYMGNHTIHMVQGGPGNPAIFFPGVADANGVCTVTVPQQDGVEVSVPGGTYTMTGQRAGGNCSSTRNTNARRILNLLNPVDGRKIAAMSITHSGGTANYHGLLVSMQRRATTGINVNTNYTWSHCISPWADNGFGGGGFNANNVYQSVTDRERGYGNCNQDRRHNFTLTTVARSPEFANAGLRAVASDWSLSVIYRINSGRYLTIENGSRDRALNGVAPTNQFGDYLGGPVTGSSGPDDEYIIRSSFARAAPGTLGNLGARNVKGPNQWDFDVSLARTFDLGETETLEFRVEAYNLTNSFRPGNPNTNLNSGRFGRTRAIQSDDPRILQFALKLGF